MLFDYVDLAGRHMTKKEWSERRKAQRDGCIYKDPLKEGEVSWSVRWKRYKRFFCTSRNPPSSLHKLKK